MKLFEMNRMRGRDAIENNDEANETYIDDAYRIII